MRPEPETVVPLHNPFLPMEEDDHLPHLGFSRSTKGLQQLFGDIKFVCTGGSADRVAHFSDLFAREIGARRTSNLCSTDRFVLYKTGPVLWVNHGMGNPSLGIVIVEVLKLLHYAKASNVLFFRIGTSCGVGVDPGTVVVSSGTLNAELNEAFVQYIFGMKVTRKTTLNLELRKDLVSLGKEMNFPISSGFTYCTDDFYEGEARLDGMFCDYTAADKLCFMDKLRKCGVRNIEMEGTCFASICCRAGVKAAIVCVTLLNRLNGDQIKIPKAKYAEMELRPFTLIAEFMKRKIASGFA